MWISNLEMHIKILREIKPIVLKEATAPEAS